jgi:hypothetical protein
MAEREREGREGGREGGRGREREGGKHILLQGNLKSCGQLRQCIENQVNFTYNYVLKLPLILTLIL